MTGLSKDRADRLPLGDEDDLTKQRLAAYDDPQAATRAMLALDAGQMGSWRWDVADGTVSGDPHLAKLFGLDLDAQPWPEGELFKSIHPDDFPGVMERVDETFEKTNLFEAEFRNKLTDPITGESKYIWLAGRASVTRRDEDGKPAEMIGVNWDISDRKKTEEQLKMFAREMDHRVKNAFAVIRALSTIGAKSGGDAKEFARTLSAQIQAMADAHQLLANLANDRKDLHGVTLLEVLRQALNPWLQNGSSSHVTLTLTCPEDITLGPDQVSAVSMLVYELTTNATKYGVLGPIGGTLEVTVTAPQHSHFVLSWLEMLNGPHADNGSFDADGSSFGKKLVSHCVMQLKAMILERVLAPSGFRFVIKVPDLAAGREPATQSTEPPSSS